MLALETDPDAFPSGTDLSSRPCDECGTTGYHPAELPGFPPSRCHACNREELRQYLVRDRDQTISRTGALRRLDSRDMLPIRDPARDGAMLLSVNVRSGPPGTTRYVASITHIVHRDCPTCGYDRAESTVVRNFCGDTAQTVECRACGDTLEHHSSL